ncbi:MAG: OmpA family protein [Gallionella sp.]
MKKTAVVLVAILIAACASAPKVETSKAQTSETGAASSANAAPAITAAAAPAAELESQKLASEAQALQNQSAYFDFDSSEIKDEYRNVILQQADFIKAHANDVVTVQGNCDERGSSEYNLGLGSERANAARKYLELLGVPAAQIRTASFGSEKPRLACHEERCWKENRRDDFVHTLNQ